MVFIDSLHLSIRLRIRLIICSLVIIMYFCSMKRLRDIFAYEKMLDYILHLFENRGMSNDQFYALNAPDGNEILAFLVSEKYLQQDKLGIKITYKGRMHLKDGGFTGILRRRIMRAVLSVITAIAAVAGVLLTIVL